MTEQYSAEMLQIDVPMREVYLINGYIRSIEKKNLKKIIPYSINMICIDYYHSVKLLYHFSEGFQSFTLADLDLNTSYIYSIYTLHGLNQASLKQVDESIVWNSAMCLEKQLKIPHEINQNILCMKNDNFNISSCNKYNTIFKCGGSREFAAGSEYCSAFIMSPHVASSTKQVSYHWKLPNYPQPMECHSIVYSNKYGLLSVGGYENGNERLFYNLNFTNFGNKLEWKWNKMSSTKDKRSWTSIVYIDNIDSVICVGGYDVNIGAINTCEIFNFKQENKWKYNSIKNIRHKRYRHGILYDSINSKIYICGGKWALQSTEWYDFNKNKWYDNIPKYKYKIDHYPVLWIEKNNCLYCASDSANCLQFIDLREMKKWNIIYGKKHDIQTLGDKVGVEFTFRNTDHTRLLL